MNQSPPARFLRFPQHPLTWTILAFITYAVAASGMWLQ
jgi:hypothetical protein